MWGKIKKSWDKVETNTKIEQMSFRDPPLKNVTIVMASDQNNMIVRDILAH